MILLSSIVHLTLMIIDDNVQTTVLFTFNIRVSTIAGLDYWTGLLDWTTGLDYWTTGLDYLMLILDQVHCQRLKLGLLCTWRTRTLTLRIRNLEPRVTGFVDAKRRTVRRPPKS